MMASIVSQLSLSFTMVSRVSTFFIRGAYKFSFGLCSSLIPVVVSVSSHSHSDNKPFLTTSPTWGKQVPQNHILSPCSCIYTAHRSCLDILYRCVDYIHHMAIIINESSYIEYIPKLHYCLLV